MLEITIFVFAEMVVEIVLVPFYLRAAMTAYAM